MSLAAPHFALLKEEIHPESHQSSFLSSRNKKVIQ
jgi:WD40 repeat protein